MMKKVIGKKFIAGKTSATIFERPNKTLFLLNCFLAVGF